MHYRFGIVGAGMIAGIHAQALDAMPNASLSAIMDRGTGDGERIAPGLDRSGCDDLRTFAARADVDIVCIASPSGAHLEAALAAAEAGKHCISEKPMEVTVERIDRMIEAHRRAGTTLGGLFNTRYTEGAQLLKAAAEAGRFGRLTYAAAVGPWWREQSYYDDSSWKGTWALDGGGALMNQGIHSVDLLQWLVGARVRRLSGRIATLAHERVEVEDTASATLEFDNGALGHIACTTSMWPGHYRTVTLAGDAGTAVLADGNLLQWSFRDQTPEDERIRARLQRLPGASVGASDPSAGITADGHRSAFEAFLQALDEDRAPAVDGAEARKAVAIIRAVYASSQLGGQAIDVDM
ncbi:MAG: Gfo/Idh/MocA family protein [Gammaproteobacteria bacterium]